ncbi:MAG: hypothetical protein FWD48_12135 [Oscillospiraceae bacterium]|nr:hypothetical protein [Oscillospiraceae bacterium]
MKISQGERIALTELRAMLPFFLIANGAVLIISAVIGIAGVFNVSLDFGIFTGLLFGSVVSAANFYFIGFASSKLLGRSPEAGNRGFAGVAFGLRFFGMFALYWVLATFGLINLFTALIPLLYPSFYYKIKAIFNKSV